MKTNKLFSLLLPLFFITSSLFPTAFIFDLGETLITVNQTNFALKAASVRSWLSYVLQCNSIRSIKTALPEKLYTALEYAGKQAAAHPELLARDFHNRPLPLIMCAWMEGRISEEECLSIVEVIIDQLDADNFFANNAERTVLCGLMREMFKSEKIIASSKPIRQMINIIEELAQEVDEKGNKKHQFYVLSNIDQGSFEHIATSKQFKKLFKYIPKDHWVASAEIGIIKPHPEIFTFLLEKYSLTPQDTLFIDDRIENICTAHTLDIPCCHFDKNNVKKFRKFLKKHGYLGR